MKDTSLKLTEIHKTLRQVRRKVIKEAKSNVMSFSRPMTEVIVHSGAFTIDEVNALQGFFEFRGRIPLLNENTIRMVDSEINSKFVQEGIISWLKDKKDKVINALKSGWEGLKKIWSNFKEFVASCIQSIKDAFKKMTDAVLEKVQSGLDWISKMGDDFKAAIGNVKEADAKAGGIQGFIQSIDDKANKALGLVPDKFHSTLVDDIKNNILCVAHIRTKVKEILSGASWQSQVESGKGSSDIKTNESIKKELTTLFSNTEVMLEFRSLNLKEAGIEHPEDVIKTAISATGESGSKIGKALSAVVKVVLGILKYTLGIFSTIVNKIGAVVAKNLFKAISYISSTFGGPGTFEMTALGFFFGELAEVVGHDTHSIHHFIESAILGLFGIAKVAMPWAIPALETLQLIVTIVGNIFYYYAIATIVTNTVIPAIKLWIEAAKELVSGDSNATRGSSGSGGMGDAARNMSMYR